MNKVFIKLFLLNMIFLSSTQSTFGKYVKIIKDLRLELFKPNNPKVPYPASVLGMRIINPDEKTFTLQNDSDLVKIGYLNKGSIGENSEAYFLQMSVVYDSVPGKKFIIEKSKNKVTKEISIFVYVEDTRTKKRERIYSKKLYRSFAPLTPTYLL